VKYRGVRSFEPSFGIRTTVAAQDIHTTEADAALGFQILDEEDGEDDEELYESEIHGVLNIF
jgi:hypothetical protein